MSKEWWPNPGDETHAADETKVMKHLTLSEIHLSA